MIDCFYHLMFREQVYNSRGWDSPQPSPSPETSRRLNRRINHNVGLLDRSRNSNNSNSFRLKRTELSGERGNYSRDNSQQNSGLTSEGYNENIRATPRRMGSVLSLSRRRHAYDANRMQAAPSRSGRNVVENLYMLTNNTPRYADRRQQPYRQPKQQYIPAEGYQRYEEYPRKAIAERRPQPQHQPHYSPERYPQRYPVKHHEPEIIQKRAPTPTRGSALRIRRSRDKSGIRGEKSDGSRDRNYKQIGNGSRDPNNRKYPDREIRKLEEKYMQNIYELNSPRNDRNYKENDQRAYGRQDKQFYNRGKNEKAYKDDRMEHHDRVYREQQQREGRRYRGEPVYQQRGGGRRYEGSSRDGYRQGFYQGKSDQYREGGSRGVYQEKRMPANNKIGNKKFDSYNSGKHNPAYYYQDQLISSTTAGIKTQPQISRYDSISDAQLPIRSVASHKELLKNGSGYDQPKKNSVKLDRPKNKNKNYQERSQRDQRQESDLQDRWKKNNILLKQRSPEPLDRKKQKLITQIPDMASLPLGSVFLPVQSKRQQRQQRREWAEDILQRIFLHLECLNVIADYTKEFKSMYDHLQPWQVLIFLSYKKFYIQRMKIMNILKAKDRKKSQQSSCSLQVYQNPLILPYSKVSDDELNRFRESKQCFALIFELQTQNARIRDALRGLYNLYIQKSGEHVNMLDCDNFSDQIYKLMQEELDGISQNLQDKQLIMATRVRMGKIIKVGLLIAYLNGKYVKNFAQILLHEDMIKVGKRQTLREDSISHLFLTEFRRTLAST